ncbi:hypothetical protein BD770DRAFT_379393 [Pilaira anomala]|nr:hypothetical protein BD770DRAFT_379393 [Pilaira anomala]
MGLRNDYRVSTIVVLCKDCGEDVGLYPARHACSNVKRPHLPTLCSTTDTQWDDVPELIKSGPTSATVTRQASDSSIESGKWNFFRSSTQTVKEQQKPKEEEEGYYNIKNSSSYHDFKRDSSNSGRKLWGKVKENEKWKELIAEKKDDTTKPTKKLWSRIIQVTMSNPIEDAGPESDDEDFEGETHVSRILREYYESKNKPLPTWLYDDTTTQQSQTKRKSARRLWQQDDTKSSAREREIEALRNNSSISRTQSERTLINPKIHTTRSPIKSYLGNSSNNIPSSSSYQQQNRF